MEMFDLGGKWMSFGGELREIHGQGGPPVDDIVAKNKDLAIDSFLEQWRSPERGQEVVKDGGQGAMIVGAGLLVAAGLVLVLKIAVIVQITLLAIQIASALAAAVATFGASLAWIPVAKKLASLAINFVLGKVIEAVLA